MIAKEFICLFSNRDSSAQIKSQSQGSSLIHSDKPGEFVSDETKQKERK